MKLTYPKTERLKSRTAIDALFTAGKSISIYPLRLVVIRTTRLEIPKVMMGVSVSKRNFKKAVDRNYFKRLLREAYRLNQDALLEYLKNDPNQYNMMLLYQTKERLSFDEINQKTNLLFEKFQKSFIENP
jgi:ribonuclease P protein component